MSSSILTKWTANDELSEENHPKYDWSPCQLRV